MKGQQYPLFDDVCAGPSLREVAEAVRAAGIGSLTEATRRADQARYQEVHVRSALSAVKGMPFSWALNPYRGCTHACEYCYARKYQRHLELGSGDEFSSFILVKRNLVSVLERDVSRPRWARETVAVGTATDPYQPIEGHYRITRDCLAVLAAHRTPFSVVTKGPMVVRDLDVLRAATASAGCRVYMSVPTVDEGAWARLEPGTASPEQRLRAASRLASAGIDVGILMMPLVPGISTARSMIERTVRAIAASGVRLAGANVAHLDAGVRDYFFGFLTREYPALVEGYERLYRGSYAAKAYVDDVTKSVRDAERACARPDASGR